MENLIFSLNATVPIFLMMVLGMVFRKIGWMDVEFAEKMNKFVFLFRFLCCFSVTLQRLILRKYGISGL